MNYKKIIKSRKTREKILQFLNFIPDKQMIQIQYKVKTGRKLNLKEPKRFTEKLQWYKLYYRDPLMKQCVDKYDVREYVKSCGLENILIPAIGVYDNIYDICWNDLPNKFVIKDTLGGGGNSVIICEKNDINKNIFKQLKQWLNIPINIKNSGREWVYEGKKHRIYIEEFLEFNKEEKGLIDYKFFCFNGKARYLYVIAERELGKGAKLGIYTADYEKLNVFRCDERRLEQKIPRPKNYSDLLDIAEKLAKPFPHARIDLYDIDGKIYFGEITFFDGSGYMLFAPDQFDYQIGDKFKLPERRELEC